MSDMEEASSALNALHTTSNLSQDDAPQVKRVYQYQPLDPRNNEIRLLTIYPYENKVNGKYPAIQCSLSVASLDHPPIYRALSYTWGDLLSLKPLYIDGCRTHVTRSLYYALWQLQSRTRTIVIWADALCINQKDDSERSEQVGKMRLVYKKAEGVIVWLGKGEESVNTSLAFNLINDVYQHRHDYDYVKAMIEHPSATDSLEALLDLFRRRYWTRAWVVQEVNSAKERNILCGKHVLDWNRLRIVQRVLGEEHDKSMQQKILLYPHLRDFSKALYRFGVRNVAIRTSYLRHHTALDIFTLLSIFWEKDTTDPRDKVYAFVGLSTARDDPKFIIDYTLSVAQVYTSVAQYIILTTGKLDVILSTPRGDNQYGLPSWVPDWNCEESQCGKSNIILIEARRDTKQSQFTATNQCFSQSETQCTDGKLTVRGIRLDQMDRIGHGGLYFRDNTEWTPEPLAVVLGWFDLLLAGVDEQRLNLFSDTIFLDHTPTGERDKSTGLLLNEMALGFMLLLSQDSTSNAALSPAWTELKEKCRHAFENTSDPKWKADAFDWVETYLTIWYKRTLFASSTGLVGVGPDSIQVGDLVCVLLGCSMPVVLRPVDDYYEFLGASFIHKYMWGLAMEELDAGKLRLETFEIH